MDWSNGVSLPETGETLLLTGRMYQMLPYVVEATKMIRSLQPFLGCRGFRAHWSGGPSCRGADSRWKARSNRALAERTTGFCGESLRALGAAGLRPVYLYESSPYSGALLHDLGLEADFHAHSLKLYSVLKARNITRIITVDPHTAHVMKTVYPACFPDFNAHVTHYLEDLNVENIEVPAAAGNWPGEMVMHDSCLMVRELGILDQTRKLCAKLGIRLLEPENSGVDTACCGGPIEYAFSDLSEQISNTRIQELKAICPNILVTCPICLINLAKHQPGTGLSVYDIGELLYSAYAQERA